MLIEALFDPQEYQDDVGALDRIACLATISFKDWEKYANI